MMVSASAGSQPVSDWSASRAPMSHDAPTTPPAPRTSPTRIGGALPRLHGGKTLLSAMSDALSNGVLGQG